MNDSRLVSIIVPVYNAERYLRFCLDSIVAQSYHNIEVFLIDDECTDNSGTICDEYSSKYQYITTIHQKNKGCGFSRNTGLDVMKGDYYTFIDADDYVSKFYIEKMVSCIEKYNADIVTTGTLFMLETRNERKRGTGNVQVYGQDECKSHTNAPSWGKLYRTSSYGHIRYDRASYEDVPYADMIRPLTNCVVEYNQCLYVYRAYQDSITRGNFGKKVLNRLHKEFEEEFEDSDWERESWIEDIRKAFNTVQYRGQEVLYRYYIHRISKDIDILNACNAVDKSILDLVDTVVNSSKAGIRKRVLVKIKHFINVIASKYKTLIKYNISVD